MHDRFDRYNCYAMLILLIKVYSAMCMGVFYNIEIRKMWHKCIDSWKHCLVKHTSDYYPYYWINKRKQIMFITKLFILRTLYLIGNIFISSQSHSSCSGIRSCGVHCMRTLILKITSGYVHLFYVNFFFW